MRYQVNAILSSSVRDFDALVRLLAESCESFELKKLTTNGSTAAPPRGGSSKTRYGRMTRVRLAADVSHVKRDQEKRFAELLIKRYGKASFTRNEATEYLKLQVQPNEKPSVSPVMTRLLDQRALLVIPNE